MSGRNETAFTLYLIPRLILICYYMILSADMTDNIFKTLNSILMIDCLLSHTAHMSLELNFHVIIQILSREA